MICTFTFRRNSTKPVGNVGHIHINIIFVSDSTKNHIKNKSIFNQIRTEDNKV